MRRAAGEGAWLLLDSLLPVSTGWGARWNDHRTVINGIFHRAGDQRQVRVSGA
ncbi:hypothetical protein [Nonomuraea sp. 10N515B]|uniref:hypothetical protein n=1 Tax=Nonomuraea sp. 10N515B TaxID=3457422 RepID=UPI003FCCD2CE